MNESTTFLEAIKPKRAQLLIYIEDTYERYVHYIYKIYIYTGYMYSLS